MFLQMVCERFGLDPVHDDFGNQVDAISEPQTDPQEHQEQRIEVIGNEGPKDMEKWVDPVVGLKSSDPVFWGSASPPTKQRNVKDDPDVQNISDEMIGLSSHPTIPDVINAKRSLLPEKISVKRYHKARKKARNHSAVPEYKVSNRLMGRNLRSRMIPMRKRLDLGEKATQHKLKLAYNNYCMCFIYLSSKNSKKSCRCFDDNMMLGNERVSTEWDRSGKSKKVSERGELSLQNDVWKPGGLVFVKILETWRHGGEKWSCGNKFQKLQELHNAGTFSTLTDKLNKEQLSGFQAVVLVDTSFKRATEFEDYCHSHQSPIAFIKADIRGLSGSLFCGFGPQFTVLDIDGDEPHFGIVAYVSNENHAVTELVVAEIMYIQWLDPKETIEVVFRKNRATGRTRRPGICSSELIKYILKIGDEWTIDHVGDGKIKAKNGVIHATLPWNKQDMSRLIPDIISLYNSGGITIIGSPLALGILKMAQENACVRKLETLGFNILRCCLRRSELEQRIATLEFDRDRNSFATTSGTVTSQVIKLSKHSKEEAKLSLGVHGAWQIEDKLFLQRESIDKNEDWAVVVGPAVNTKWHILDEVVNNIGELLHVDRVQENKKNGAGECINSALAVRKVKFKIHGKLALGTLLLELSAEQSCILICSEIDFYLKHKWKIKSGNDPNSHPLLLLWLGNVHKGMKEKSSAWIDLNGYTLLKNQGERIEHFAEEWGSQMICLSDKGIQNIEVGHIKNFKKWNGVESYGGKHQLKQKSSESIAMHEKHNKMPENSMDLVGRSDGRRADFAVIYPLFIVLKVLVSKQCTPELHVRKEWHIAWTVFKVYNSVSNGDHWIAAWSDLEDREAMYEFGLLFMISAFNVFNLDDKVVSAGEY